MPELLKIISKKITELIFRIKIVLLPACDPIFIVLFRGNILFKDQIQIQYMSLVRIMTPFDE